MKKITLLTLLFFCSFLFTQASNWVGINNNSPENATISLVSSDISNSIVKFNLSGFMKNEVLTPNGNEYVITVGEGTHILLKGAPDLAKLTASVIIPDKGVNSIEVLSSKYTEYTNISVAPSKGNFTRDIDPASVPYTYGEVYQKNEFFPGKLADLREPYIARDYRGQTIITYPFQYNPVTKVLRVYTEITVKVVNNDKATGINELSRAGFPEKIDIDYENIYKHQFINFGKLRYTPLGEQGKMLIICYGSFMSAMQPFVDWKNTIGIPTVMVDVATAGGTAAAIKTYVQNYYNTNGLTFLLLVGDAAQVPTFTVSGGGSDNTYGYFTGNDHYQEIFVGRFSAENTTHVTTQVNRTINYELTPTTTPNKFNRLIGIASDQGPGDDGEYDYQHIRNIGTDLLAFTYLAPTVELFDGSQGGNDAAGNPTPTMVGNEINTGAGIINYTGHGSDNSWGTSGFSSTNVAALTNTVMQPFIWSVACVNGNFVSGTCFAEAWLRATYNGLPSGSVATFMSTINQSWNPPMEGQDEMVDILCEHYPTNIKRTFAGLSINGCFKMNDTYNDVAMTDTWTIFGDPSLMVRTAVPGTLTVTHAPNIVVGAIQFTVNCTTESAFVALTINNQIIGTGRITSGTTTITFPGLTSVGTLKIAVTAFNKIPYIQTIPIIAPAAPYIVLNGYTTTAAPNFNSSIGFNVTLQNVAGSPYNASNVNATFSTTNTYITITDNTESYGTINAGASVLRNNAFGINIANNVPDQTNVSFNIHSTGTYNSTPYSWDSPLNLVVNAPVMSIGNISVSDPLPTGNNNGRLDPGETATVSIQSSNTGHANATGVVGTLTESSPWITITNGTYNIGNLNFGATVNATFTVVVDNATPIGTPVTLNYTLTGGQYNATKPFVMTIGMIYEDWETNTFTKFPWQNPAPSWTLVSGGQQYEGTYCAKSATITHSQSTNISINYQVDATNDSIKFYKKVNSESGYDYLEFYIDATRVDRWSGTTDVWSFVKYPVTQGTHIFKWQYMKDGSVTTGSDCGWVDYIIFPAGRGVGINSHESNLSDISINCYPNPANNSTTVSYSLNKASVVLLTVYNSYGEVVKVMVNNTKQSEGLHNMTLDVNDLSSGIYYCVLKTDNNVITKKITVTR